MLGSCGNGDYDSNGYNGVCRRQAAHILIAEGDTTPSEPFEPSCPKGVSMPSRRLVFITDCLKCGMYRDSSPTAQNDCAGREGKHVTLSLYSSPVRAIPPPSAAKRLSNFRTLRTFGAKGSVNPHAKGVSKGDTTTLSSGGAVKLQNLKTLRGEAPSTFSCEPGSPRGLYHSSSPQGSSEMLSRRMYTFSVSYSICSDQRVTARMRSWVRAHSRRMKVTLSRL